MATVIEDARDRVVPEVEAPRLGGFWALTATQFQGAFSDNTLKWLVSFLVLETAASKEERGLWFGVFVPLLFLGPFFVVFHPRWIFGGQVQQTQRDGWDGGWAIGGDGTGYVGVGARAAGLGW